MNFLFFLLNVITMFFLSIMGEEILKFDPRFL